MITQNQACDRVTVFGNPEVQGYMSWRTILERFASSMQEI
jgi:hypothetical protein